MLTIDKKPPVIGGDLPPLPPFLRKRGGPERRTVILPCILMIQRQSLIYDHENNWTTIVYEWMNRVTGESIFSDGARWETAHSHSRKYRQWLETYDCPDGIPPHISFGGAIKSGAGDPTFYPRWKEMARETFF